MKKSILSICAIAAALLLAGCQKENINVVETAEATHTVVFTAEKMVETKTAIASEENGMVSYKWIAGDDARMYITESYVNGGTTVVNSGTIESMSLSNEDKTADFTVTFSGNAPTGDITYRAVYGGSFSDDHNPLIPATQSPRTDSFDPNADVMVGVVNRTSRDENPTSIRFNMERKVSVNKMTLKGLKEGEVVKSVTFESDKTHSTYFLVSSGSYDTDAANCSNKLTFTFISNNTVPSSREFPVYFTTAPVEGATFTVNVVTNQHRYSKPSTKAITFKTGEVRRFGVTLPAGQDIDPIEGDYLIGAYVDGEWYLMNPNPGANFFPGFDTDITTAVSAVEYSDFSDITNITNYQWRVEAYGEGYSIRSINTSNYLYYSPGVSPSNEAYANSVLSEHTCFNVSITDKLATIQSRENTERVLRYNSNGTSNRFAFYKGTQNDIYLIPVYDDGLRPVTLSFTDSAINTDTNDYTNVTGQTVAVSPNESAITNAITYSMAGDPIGSVDPSTGAVTLNGTAGVATVTATFFGDATYRATTAEYTITVVQIDNVMYKIVKSIDDVTEGTYVIVNYGHYLPNAAATNAGPIMNDNTKVTILGDYVINVTGDMTWDFTGTTDAMTITSTITGNTKYYLYNNSSNAGVRVSTINDRTWSINTYPNTTAFYLKDNSNNRHCAACPSEADWRSYDSYNAGNYGDGGKIYLYKKIDFRGDAPISWSAATGNVTLTENGPSMTLPTLTNTQDLSIAYASNNESVATIANDGTITAISSGTAVISATFDGSNISEQYKTTTVTYTLSVIDNRPTVATPTFTLASGEVTSGTTVSINCTTSGATIYYTTGDSEFSAGDWTEYSGPITITTACTLKSIAIKTYYKNSSVASASYTIAGEGGNETITFSDLYSQNTTLDEVVISGDNFSVTFNKRSGGTATQYYTNGYAVRWYGGGTLRVDAASNRKLTEISISFTQTANSISVNKGTYDSGTWTSSTTSGESSVIFTQSGTSGQCRISSITVSYK